MGDGKWEIDYLWSDPWIGDEEGHFIKRERVEGLELVGDLIDEERKEWRLDVIVSHFH